MAAVEKAGHFRVYGALDSYGRLDKERLRYLSRQYCIDSSIEILTK